MVINILSVLKLQQFKYSCVIHQTRIVTQSFTAYVASVIINLNASIISRVTFASLLTICTSFRRCSGDVRLPGVPVIALATCVLLLPVLLLVALLLL